MSDDVRKFIDKISKDISEEIVALQEDDGSVEGVSTGSLALDVSTGIGGIPRGRLTELWGSNSTGKTTLALCISRSVIQGGGRVLYVDNEQTLSLQYARTIIPEADDSNFVVLNPELAEDSFRAAESGVKSGLFELVVIDSLPSLPSREQVEKGWDKETRMIFPRLVNKFLNLVLSASKKNGTAILALNQVRANTSSYTGGYSAPGGEQLKHAKSLEIFLTKGKAIEDSDGNRVGGYTNFVIRKNKFAIPFRSAQFPIIYGEGVDYIRDAIEFGALLGVVKRKGAYYYFEETNIGQGLFNACDTLRENSELLDSLVSKVKETVK